MNKLVSLLLILLTCSSAYALKPVKEYSLIPDTQHEAYENNTITTADNVKLKSWTLLPDKKRDKKTTLVLAYADAGNMSWWINRAVAFAHAGYTVLLFDYRGFGESDAFAIDQQMLYYNDFASDLAAAIQFAKGKYKRNRTGVLCYSMGSIITTLTANIVRPDFIIGEGYVTDPVAIVAASAKKGKEIKLPKGSETYKRTLERQDTKMLIFSGSTDVVTTDETITELKAKRPGITVVKFNGGHMQGFDALSKEEKGSEYIKAVNEFLK